jgi:hypothetical protein
MSAWHRKANSVETTLVNYRKQTSKTVELKSIMLSPDAKCLITLDSQQGLGFWNRDAYEPCFDLSERQIDHGQVFGQHEYS